MKNLLLLPLLLPLLLNSCGPKPQNKHLTYQNIVILADMSDRLDSMINGSTKNQQYPPKDIDEIHKIVQYFKDECVKPGEKIGDKSSIYFSAFSQNASVLIDIDGIKDLSAKQSFINSTGNYADCGLEQQLADFENKVKNYYATIKNPGLDLISVLMEKITNENIVKSDNLITDGIDTTFICYENHIYIFTDGYLEYAFSQKQKNSQYYFGANEVNKVRQYCKNNNLDVATALNNDTSLCLPRYETGNNKFINLHILETHERDKNTYLQTYSNPKGLRDNEILEVVWRRWATESGFKSFEWKKY
jgi:hypothetical protein